MGWLKEYKDSLKLIEVEEFLDLFFYRPLAFLFVKLIYKTNLTPNQITVMAMIVGIIGGVIILYNTRTAFIIAALLLILYDVLDCSDGMVARLKKNGTSVGRILDGVADYFVTVTVYLGIGFGFASNSESPLFYWLLLILAGASNIIHAVALDYYRNRFIDYATNRDSLLGDNLDEFKEEYARLKKESGNIFSKSILWIYLKYSNLQLKFSKSEQQTKIKKYKTTDFYKKNKIIMHLWTYIGPTTELTFIILAALFNRFDLFIYIMISVVNIYALVLFIVQAKIDKNTKLAEIK